MACPAPSTVTVNLSRLDANVAAWRDTLAPASLCAVVKADAYGLGAAVIARRIERAGVDMFAVYCPDQAAALLEAGISTPILIMLGVTELPDELAQPLRTLRLHLTVHHPAQLEAADRIGKRRGVSVPVHLHLDTGMSRGGLNDAQFAEALARVRALKHATLAGVSTHFASASHDGSFTAEQDDRLLRAVEAHRNLIPAGVILHTANTAGALRDRKLHHDMARIGLGLYGYAGGFSPVVRWTSSLVHMQRYPPGSPVGYSSTCRTRRDSVLGIVPVGYGDGYPLALSNKGCVSVRGGAAPIRGKVNMDQLIVDLTDIAGATVGDEVVIYSDDPDSPCAVPTLARLADSHPYELLCRISPRLGRTYRG